MHVAPANSVVNARVHQQLAQYYETIMLAQGARAIRRQQHAIHLNILAHVTGGYAAIGFAILARLLPLQVGSPKLLLSR